MKAIAVVFIPARNGHVSPEATLELAPSEPLKERPVVNGGNNGVHPFLRDQSAPPFWTWFIENPRAKEGRFPNRPIFRQSRSRGINRLSLIVRALFAS